MPADLHRPGVQQPQGGRSWQLLAFIVLALAMAGSLPTLLRIYQVIETGVTWEQVPFALHQRALWERNRMCAAGPGEQVAFPAEATPADLDQPLGQPRRVAAFTGMALRLQACWNGDVLVRTVQADGLGRAVWIAAEGFELQDTAWLTEQALAQADIASQPAAPDQTFDVICQEWDGGSIDSGRVIRVIAVEGARTREIINILTGEVVSADTVSPDVGCKPDDDA
ncbi:hypothetical protein [Dichotomicrobium thermohalophilum]|uniref:Uncharacterized protein n=1 Tax=Dichotomicrobium thermohalophilum TaxID=933063 RepID=A0A397Q6Z4_9HYPH|nr:hypothetical protein [Dichotomicrobium thermohalophilum]RIA55565.1 hypothetical protein BXY53_0633 [Dichotomicrobium thermohalophilum]